MEQKPTRVILLHIPKTAGSTLRRIVENEYGLDRVFTIGPSVEESLDELSRLSDAAKARLRAFLGHMAFGLDERLSHPATYVTLLRDPIDRVISHYCFARRDPGSPLHDEIVARKLTLEGYVRKSKHRDLFNNGQTRLLGSGLLEPARPATERTLATAKRNLERVAVAGLTERFDEAVVLMERQLGWRLPTYRRQKVSRDRPRREDLPDATLRAIVERNELDAEFYRYASERFDRLVDAAGPSLAAEVEQLRRLNRAALGTGDPG